MFGRDPRLQFVHVDDALEVLRRSVVEDHPGTYNVAGPGVLLLSQAIRRAGRVAVPVRGAGAVRRSPRSRADLGVGRYGLDQLDLFVHGRVVDTTRLVEEFGFTPRSTAVAFDDFIRAHHGGVVLSRGPARRRRAGDARRHPAGPRRRGTVVSDHGGRPDRSRRPEPPAGSDGPGDLWDRRVAAGLAFLRRRLSGQYEVDEFGFDPS